MTREMKYSGVDWIGEIPSHWKVVRTKNCYTTHKYVVGENADAYERLALTLDGVIKRPKNDATGLQPKAFNSYQILRENELVFKLIDLANISTSRVGYSPYNGIVSPAYIVLQPNQEEESEFGVYYFLSMWQREIFNNMGDDGVRSSLNAGDLLNIPYVSIPVKERKRIVAFLKAKCARIDEAVEKTRTTIEEYNKLKQSIITQAVTKGIRAGSQMEDSGIEWVGETPTEWGVNTVFQFFAQVKNRNSNLKEKNLLSLSYGKIKRKNINTTEGLLPESFDGYNIVEADDIVLRLTDLQNDHKSLRVGIATEKGIITSAYITLRNRSKSIAKYLYYYLHSFDVSKGFYGMGDGVRQSLNWNGLKWLRLLTPPINEQKEIVEYCDKKVAEIEDLIDKKDKLVLELEDYKKSLIYDYVTGKKEVI